MADTVIDTLQVKVTANAQAASTALKSLTRALRQIKTEITGWKDGLPVTQSLSRSFGDLNRSLNSINTTSVKKLQKLSNTLTSYVDSVRAVKTLSGGSPLAKSIKDVEKALSVRDGTATSTGNSSNTKADKTKEATEEVKKLGDETKKAGEKAKKAAGFFGKFIKSIGRIMLYRAIRSALKAIGEAFDTGLKNAYAFSKQHESFTRLADTLDRVKSITSQMINQLGAMWGEIRQFIMPAIEWIVEKVRYVSERLTEFFAALNGEHQYQYARYVEKSWDDATESVKKYKHQLLGLDELNNLSKDDTGKLEGSQTSTDYYLKRVNDNLFNTVQNLKKKVTDFFGDWHNLLLLGIGGLVLGSILLFTGHIGLGLGVIIGSGYLIGKAIGENWQALSDEIDNALKDYSWLFVLGSISLTVLGAALLFTGHIGLGLGCILGGVALAATEIGVNWEGLYTDIENAFQKFAPLFALVGIGSMVAGALLLFTGHIGLGLGLLVFGGFLTAETIQFNWDSILSHLQTAWTKVKNWWNDTLTPQAVSLFDKLERALGWDINGDGQIGMSFSQSSTTKTEGALARSVRMNGLPLGEELFGDKKPELTTQYDPQKVRDSITTYMFDKDKKPETSVATVLREGENALEGVASKIKNTIDNIAYGVNKFFLGEDTADKLQPYMKKGNGVTSYILGKANGGYVGGGTLFYAGENGNPEFIGNMNGTTAVANTQQMQDAIYKAAYMGMSKALQENGGNGLGGYEPATTDDLFIVMKKKASNYTKMTGNPAFG